MVADYSTLVWMTPHNIHVAGFIRAIEERKLFGIFNFKDKPSYLTWYAFKEHNLTATKLFDHWENVVYDIGEDREYLIIKPYGFLLLEPA